jgi:hypothetical protein
MTRLPRAWDGPSEALVASAGPTQPTNLRDPFRIYPLVSGRPIQNAAGESLAGANPRVVGAASYLETLAGEIATSLRYSTSYNRD